MSESMDYQNILLAYDGTERGRLALRRSLPLLRGEGTHAHLLAVIPVTGAVAAAEGFYSEQLYEEERQRIRSVLDEGVDILRRHGVDAVGALRCGQPARKIAEHAAEVQADLVIVGHEKRGPLARWWQGSVGASLVDLLDCSLLVVQSADETNEDGRE